MGKCSRCKYFDYDEIWDGEEEIELFCCSKGHDEHIGWNTEPCEDYEEDERWQTLSMSI